MAEPSDAAPPSGPGGYPPGGRATGASADPAQRGWQPGRWPLLLALVAVVVGTAVLGVAAGFIWAAVAPRAVIEVLGRGSADVVNPETSAFIAADGWFALLSVIGGIVSGLAGYLIAVRRHGAIAMAGVLAGAVAAALIAKWIGQLPGQAEVDHSLALGRAGTLLQQPLALGGIGVLAFWPLAAGLVAGGITGVGLLRERLREPRPRRYPPPGPGLTVPGPIPGPGTPGPAGDPATGSPQPPG
jgi:hypothetical protein